MGEKEEQTGSCAVVSKRQTHRSEGSEEQADVGSLLATWGHDGVWTWVAAKGHVWICVDIHDPC